MAPIDSEMRPTRAIVPVISLDLALMEATQQWGTAFFVGPHVLMTARHVLDLTVRSGEQLAVVLQKESASDAERAFPIDNHYLDPDHDIAVGYVPGWPENTFFTIESSDSVFTNRDVLTMDYALTERLASETSGRVRLSIQPQFHKGNIVSAATETLGHRNPTDCLNLSYPALQGASGAPVVDSVTSSVVGLIVANRERQLLPAQVLRTSGPGGSVEEVRYFLPQAQAIRASHLRVALTTALTRFRDQGLAV